MERDKIVEMVKDARAEACDYEHFTNKISDRIMALYDEERKGEVVLAEGEVTKETSEDAEPKKLVRVKAWAFVHRKNNFLVYMENSRHKDGVPCTILIDKKYLKEKK